MDRSGIMNLEQSIKLLAEQAIVDGKQVLTEDQIRSMVGAPTLEESIKCICGKDLSENGNDCYDHMTHGV
jgi:hypothetical protein